MNLSQQINNDIDIFYQKIKSKLDLSVLLKIVKFKERLDKIGFNVKKTIEQIIMTAQLYYDDKKIYSKLLKGLESIRDDIYLTNNDKLKLFYNKLLLNTLTNVRDNLDQVNTEKDSLKQVQKDSFEQVQKVVPKKSIVDKINEQLDIFNDNIKEDLNFTIIINLIMLKSKLDALNFDTIEAINKVVSVAKKFYNKKDVFETLLQTLEDMKQQVNNSKNQDVKNFYSDYYSSVYNIVNKPIKAVEKFEEEKPMKLKKERKQIKFKEEKIVKPKKIKVLKVYYGLPPAPKNHRIASMQEAMVANKINYWGYRKVDNKILDLNKEKPKKENLMVLMAGARGKANRIKGLYEASKDQDERMKLKAEYLDAVKAYQIVNEKYQKSFQK